ncbi:hypothetical protein [Desulfosporosinus metallidurans]|uniref:hypothetical protein n=1 Tax=Desulfosporosinus metallidurans TaxID=1888891 RepID=UPI00147F3455|nr:hypothetical protein [Desulfosporosinus metallidurans]
MDGTFHVHRLCVQALGRCRTELAVQARGFGLGVRLLLDEPLGYYTSLDKLGRKILDKARKWISSLFSIPKLLCWRRERTSCG